MATNFPTSVDSFTNPTAVDTLDSPPHDQQHADANDAIEAIETALLDGAPLHIDDVNERVGIGTTAPAHPLHVTGSDNRPIRAESSVSGSYIDIQDSATTAEGYVAIGAVGDEARIIAGGSTRMTIDSSGNVGINDTTPSYKLDVNGDINATGDLRIGGTAIGEWTSFTPSWTNLTVGNATQSAQYSVINEICYVHGFINFGSTTTITGSVYFDAPVAFNAQTTNYQTLGTGSFWQSSVYPIAPLRYSTYVFLFTFQASATDAVYVNVSATRPVAYSASTRITYNFSYPVS